MFWLNAGDWKLIPGPFMILLNLNLTTYRDSDGYILAPQQQGLILIFMLIFIFLLLILFLLSLLFLLLLLSLSMFHLIYI